MMRFLRRKFVVRVLTSFFLLLFIESTFLANYSFALTGGSHQPEFTSYEDAGSKDLVNLFTGNMTFNLPVLDVPGPEGNFSMPLSYHAGIGLEQEASWCGLGFNMNAGSIVRNINQYPDDASGELNSVTVKDLTGVTGWSKKHMYPLMEDWNSQTGYHGNVNLLDIIEVDFGNKTDVGLIGVHVSDNGPYIDGVQLATAVVSIVTWGAASSGAAVAKQIAIDAAISSAVNFAMPTNTPGAPTAGHWQYSKSESTKYSLDKIGSAIASIPAGHIVPLFSKKKSYHIWLDQTRNEKMYGIAYLGRPALADYPGSAQIYVNDQSVVPKYIAISDNSTGAASDVNFIVKDGVTYEAQNSPVALATDDYSVNAPGISGTISPYRLDAGFITMPRQMTSNHTRMLPVPFLDNYKVPFVYEGTISGGYFNHVGTPYTTNADPTSPNTPYYGIDYTPSGQVTRINDIQFKSDRRIRADLASIKKLPQGNNVDWFTNAEIRSSISASSQTGPSGFLDFLSAAAPDFKKSDRYKFRSNFTTGNSIPLYFTEVVPTFSTQILVSSTAIYNALNVDDPIEVSLQSNDGIPNVQVSSTIAAKSNGTITIASRSEMAPYIGKNHVEVEIGYYPTARMQDGIGGYTITATDGTRHHFALPVYDYDNYSESEKIDDPNVRTSVRRNDPFAVTWLLTAITGSDYIDRNANGLADEGDWGYWVKMNYGKQTDAFSWRVPYQGTVPDPSNKFKSYERGVRQQYYLNSIETRSHVALFLKSNREDGKSAYENPMAPLKLDEICLLKREQYKKLTTYNVPNYSNQIEALCLSSSFSSARDYVNKNCVKRILLNFAYELCTGTPNAGGPNNPEGAKLTLKSVSVRGKNDMKLVPDFKFEYEDGNNYPYDVNKWDGWGMYSEHGTAQAFSHRTNDPTGASGTAWSLARVVTPLGGDIKFAYERDTYSTISGEEAEDVTTEFTGPNGLFTYTGGPAVGYFTTMQCANASLFAVGDMLKITGEISYTCPQGATMQENLGYGGMKITAIQGNNITLSASYASAAVYRCDPMPAVGTKVNILYTRGSITRVRNKAGGDIRVKSVTVSDGSGHTVSTGYGYNDASDLSTGVVAQEPEYIRNKDYAFYSQLRYPQTPVVYGRVTVYTGKSGTPTDHYARQVFEFETPSSSMFSVSDQDFTVGTTSRGRHLFTLTDRASKIGKLISIAVYDPNKTAPISKSDLEYTEQLTNDDGQTGQGIYSESTLLFDYLGGAKQNRTTIFTYPYALKKITNTKDGLTSSTEFRRWDLLTGSSTEILSKSPLGIYTKTVTLPAYRVAEYAEMGSRAKNPANRNMLSQTAATYTYLTDAAGTSVGLISASAQQWSKLATYRYLSNGAYVESPAEPISASNPVWRKSASYVWKGSYARLQQTGAGTGTFSFSESDKFNFVALPSALWQYTGSMGRYDHFSMPLQVTDLNGATAAVKMGYDERTPILQASNAEYGEVAFSSAEDEIPTTGFFGGEVALRSAGGSAAVVRKSAGTLTEAHTGDCALKLSTGDGFVYKPHNLVPNRTYRISVWTNLPDKGRLYYKLNGATAQPSDIPARPTQGKTGWYRIEMTLRAATYTSLEVGVRSPSGAAVLFDDFRFQPVDAAMVCYVYNPLDYEYPGPDYAENSYILDNSNFYTRYQTSADGSVTKVYIESSKFQGEQLVSESKSDYKRFHIDQ
jgi:hypothetical protein